MENKYVIVLFMVIITFMLFFLGVNVGHNKKVERAYIEGYKKAYIDYKTEVIDCIVRVKFPQWIEESVEWRK